MIGSSRALHYRLYDEENKNFILSRYVIFLECDKSNSVVDRQLTHLEKFASKKFYFEYDNYVPVTERGVPILDQPVVLPSLTHKNVIAEKNWMIVMFLLDQNFLLKSLFLRLFFKMSNHQNHFNNLYESPYMFGNFQASMMTLKHEVLLKVMLLRVQVTFLMIVDSIILQLVNLVVLKKLLIVMNGRM